MRYNSSNTREKLIPLRRFAADNLYSAKYLSLLVQRNKLKASKVGRNFYTTEKWFFEYLEKHARDEVRLKYKELFVERGTWNVERKYTPLNPPSKGNLPALPGEVELSQISLPVKNGALNWLKNNIYKLGTAMFAVFFVALLVAQFMIGQDARQGAISGVEEVASTTMEVVEQKNWEGAIEFGE